MDRFLEGVAAGLAETAVVLLSLGREPPFWRGLCLRYLGFFSAVETGAAYLPTQRVALVASCGLRILRTLAWSGASVEPAAAGRIVW